ncbi:FMN-dependent NADH-azoreductase [Luteimonas aquatica]|uniref:FMN-dependent NADH-azoreductase n=1 Tax=Luteimonas aquatica TaxID=450364 RepID=UPI001F5A2C3B|nr:NAD(P)H-dependent oxidoreductase [Luteimonas aquatica]
MKILHLDSSARSGGSDQAPYGSHTRRLGQRFVRRWRASRPQDAIVHRDLGAQPPPPVDARWIHAAFTPPARRAPWMGEALALSDLLVDELIAADLIVIGAPMYNFGMPAQLKAWIDNVVRVGRTFGFDRARPGEPYWPLLAGQGKRLVLLGARGDYGYDAGGRLAARNHVEAGVATPLRYIGIELEAAIAVEYDEFADARLQASLAAAEAQVDALVDRLALSPPTRACA